MLTALFTLDAPSTLQAAMLCEQADERHDGWINLHALLAMRSVTLFFDRLQVARRI
jgi:hypothetical protein